MASQICATKSGTLCRKGMYKDAVEWAKQAFRRASRTKDLGAKAHALNALAISYIESGELSEAVQYFRDAVNYYEKLKDYPGLLTANSNLGGCLQHIGDFSAAAKHYDTALKVSQKLENVPWAAVTSNNLAELYMIWGEIEEAIKYLNIAIAAHEDNLCPIALAGLAYCNLSRCSIIQGNLDTAGDYIQRATTILKKVGVKGLQAEAELQLIELWLIQGQYKKALQYCHQILHDIEQLDAKLLQVKGERLLAMCLAMAEDTEEATVHIRRSIDMARRIGSNLEEARSLVVLARVSMEDLAGFSELTGMYINNAIDIFERIGARHDLKEARLLLEQSAA
jgi:tetratricopeptide (TPR) repeat protein